MKLYQSNGYANMEDIIEFPTPFILCIGGRGTGKTYGSIKYLLENKILFIYLRRTASEMELAGKTEFSPIVKIGHDLGMELCCESLSKYVYGVYHVDSDGKPVGAPVAYNMALSVIASCRSFDASAVKVILFDEAIPENHIKKLRNENLSILNMYESLNRNREMQGEPPLKLVCLCNANNMEAPVLDALGCIRTLDEMRKKGQSQKVISAKGLSIFLLNNSPISADKKQTALYKLAQNQDEFKDMALENTFSRDNYTDIENRPLSEYIPIASIGSICLYRHKHNYEWYVSETISGKPVQFENTITDRQRFRLFCLKSWEDYFSRKMKFSNVNAKIFYKTVMMETLK